MQQRYKLLKHWCAALLVSATVLGVTQTSIAQTVSTQKGAMRTLSYQGLITNGDKAVSDGQHSIVVTLYSDETGTTPIWSSTFTPDTKAGVFNLQLGGADHPLPEATTMDRPIWVGVCIDKATEMRPLTQLTASAYALNVADNSVTTSKLTDKAVTKEKIGADYVGSISVNGQRVSGNGTDVNLVAGNGLQLSVDPETSTIFLEGGAALGTSHSKGANGQWIGFNPGSNDDGITNTPADQTNSIGGGSNNTANPYFPGSLTLSGYCSILGGKGNTAGAHGTNIQYASIGGGFTNTANGNGSTIAGGRNNTANGSDAAIAGGSYLKVGNNTFGYNNPNGTTTTTDLTNASTFFPHPVAFFGNTDLVLGNYGATTGATNPSTLYFFDANTDPNYTTTPTRAYYAAFTASGLTADATYTLPPSAPSVSGYLLSSTTAGALSWVAPSSVATIPWSGVTAGSNPNTLDMAGGGILQPGSGGTIIANKLNDNGGVALSLGSVPFGTGSGLIGQNNANFFWDNSNIRLGIGAIPATTLDVKGNTTLGHTGASAQNLTVNLGTGGTFKVNSFGNPAGIVHYSGTPNFALSSSLVSLTADITGTLAITHGGTGATNAGAAVNNLLGIGTAGYVLTSTGSSAAWSPAPGGGAGWNQSFGNAATNPIPAGTDWVGTNDATDLAIAANYTSGSFANDDIHINATTHNVGINQPAPDPNEKLDVNGTIWSENVMGDPNPGVMTNQMGEIHKDNITLGWGLIPGVVGPLPGPAPLPIMGQLSAFNVTNVVWYPPNICVIDIALPPGFAFAPTPVSPWAPGPAGEACVIANVIQDFNFRKAAPGPGGLGVVGDNPGFATVTVGGQGGVLPLTACPAGIVPPLAPNQIAVSTYKIVIAGGLCGGGGAVTAIPTPLPFSFQVEGR